MRLIVLFASLLSTSSFACSFAHLSREELFQMHSSIFHAVLTKTELSTFTNPKNEKESVEVVVGTYKLIEAFKGSVPETGEVRDLVYGPGNCSLGLMAGNHYIFYPDENGFVLIPTGSWAFFNPDGSEVKPELENLRKLKAGK